MANGAFKFKDNSGNIVSFISGSGSNISFSGGTLDLSGMTGLTLGGLTMSGSITNALTASSAPSYLLTSSFNTYSSSLATTGSNTFIGNQTISGSIVSTVTPLVSGSSQITYSGLTGIPSGIVSGSSQLTSSYDGRYVLSGSITQTTWDNIASKPSGIASGSSQIEITGTTGYSTFSSSISTSIGSLSSSVATTTLNTKNRVDSIEAKTGSYATTGSNIFQGSQTITGSLFISQDLIVAGSSSIQHVSSSILNIADNIITVNALNPSVRFGGLAVIDSGSSPQVSGSILFDSVNNQWLFVHQNQASITSSVLLMGPETYNNVGNESYITSNRLVKSTGIEHLTNSNISDDGTTVTMLSNTIVNGTFSATGTTLVSGSSQIAHDSTTGYVANRHIDHTAVSISAGNGLSGGGDISSTRTISLDTTSATFTTGVKTKMNADGVISGSAQVTFGSLTGIPSGIVSGSSQITFGSISSIPSGLVSGSSQISLTSTTGFGTYLNQALLTTSTPTFSTVSATTFTGALSGNATTASSISGFNNPATTATANTIVYRDSSGDITTRYFLGSYVNTTDDISTGTITHIMAKFGDNYHRSATAAKVQSFLGLGSLAYSSATIPTNNNQLTNGAGYITSYSETDTLGSVTNRGSSTSQNIVFSNGRKGLVGVYDAAQTQAIFAMGIDYILTNGGASSTIGNHYGLAWSYNPDYGGAGNNPQSKAGLNHQLLHMQAGITTTAIGSGIWTSGGITCGTILPLSNNNYNLGSTGTRWANIYTNDLHLSNEGKEGGNEIDGTTGDWTIQEGQENLYIINHKNGKKFKIDLTEII
jgi:hypothetical protein